jgi:hypothetical protein
VKNLTIRAGTLTEDERKIINHHIVAHDPDARGAALAQHLTNVPEYAGGHHERMDGKGYPKGLTARADVGAGALHGHRRHLRGAHRQGPALQEGQDASPSRSDILGKVQGERPHRSGLVRHFVRRKVYQRYAEMFLDPDQIDEVDPSKIPVTGPRTARLTSVRNKLRQPLASGAAKCELLHAFSTATRALLHRRLARVLLKWGKVEWSRPNITA